ncbi:MAG: DUF3572 family protein [Hyphomicrobiaceae bacterium]
MLDKRRASRLTQQAAEEIAAHALLFLAGDTVRMGRFLAETGLGPAELQAQVREPDTLRAVLSSLVSDEAALLAFAANAGLQPEQVVKAEAMLGGGSSWDST